MFLYIKSKPRISRDIRLTMRSWLIRCIAALVVAVLVGAPHGAQAACGYPYTCESVPLYTCSLSDCDTTFTSFNLVGKGVTGTIPGWVQGWRGLGL